jgi:ribonuclease HII
MKKDNKIYLIWVDEAGRGAWAGPVVAWAFCVEFDFDFTLLPGLTDSKKLSPQKREVLLEAIKKLDSDRQVLLFVVRIQCWNDRYGRYPRSK